MFFKKRKEIKVLDVDLKTGDVFEKNDKVPSSFIVDKIMDFSPAPIHVRLREVGGNERMVTVALTTLMDEHFWTKISQ